MYSAKISRYNSLTIFTMAYMISISNYTFGSAHGTLWGYKGWWSFRVGNLGLVTGYLSLVPCTVHKFSNWVGVPGYPIPTKFVPNYLVVVPGYLVGALQYYGVRFKGTLLNSDSTWVLRVPRYEG